MPWNTILKLNDYIKMERQGVLSTNPTILSQPYFPHMTVVTLSVNSLDFFFDHSPCDEHLLISGEGEELSQGSLLPIAYRASSYVYLNVADKTYFLIRQMDLVSTVYKRKENN